MYSIPILVVSFFVFCVGLPILLQLFCPWMSVSRLYGRMIGTVMVLNFNLWYTLTWYSIGTFINGIGIWILEKLVLVEFDLLMPHLENQCMLLNARKQYDKAEILYRRMMSYYHSLSAEGWSADNLQSYLVTAEDYASMLEIKGDMFASRLLLAEAADLAARNNLEEIAETLAQKVDRLALEKPPDDNR